MYGEIEGIVKGVDDPSITIPKMTMMNSFYDVGAWCTSIIVKQADGTIIHSRDLDYGNAEDQMAKMTYRAKFHRSGKYVFDAVMFSGTVEVFTGMRAGGFSISQNTRTFDKDPLKLFENLWMLFRGGNYTEQAWLIREVLANCEDYDCAYKSLSKTPIDSLGYYILAGTKGDEGVVFSRSNFGVAHEVHLNSSDGTWFLVQTNNDHWLPNGCGNSTGFDPTSLNRCAAATKRLQDLGQAAVNNVTLRNEVLLKAPNFNKYTLYNTDFTPSQGFINTLPLDVKAKREGVDVTDRPRSILDAINDINPYF
jgi:hypothetical protein